MCVAGALPALNVIEMKDNHNNNLLPLGQRAASARENISIALEDNTCVRGAHILRRYISISACAHDIG